MPKAHKENARLVVLIEEEQLTRPLVATITGTTKACVDQWLRQPGTENYRQMNERYLRLLEFELGRRAPQFTRVHRQLQDALKKAKA